MNLSRIENIPGFFEVDSKSHTKKEKRRSDVCYGNSPKKSLPSTSPKTVVKDKFPEARISLGSLGEFVIKMFQDGFIITSILDGNTVEISNIGQNLIFVSDRGGDLFSSSKHSHGTVTGSVSGNTITCSIRLKTAGKLLMIYICNFHVFNHTDLHM